MAMHPKRKQRLLIVLAIVIGSSLAAVLLFSTLSDNLNLFYPPSEIKQGKAPINKRIRAGGMVAAGSVERQADGLTVEFEVTDYEANLRVRYTGILPDLFAEEDGVVVAGVIDENGIMQADEVLAKHDENYMPPEVASTLKNKPEKAINTDTKTPSPLAVEP